MTLNIYNTLTRQKEPFKTIENNKVLMYCCGITVYDYCHLGHARTCMTWDVVRNYLQWCGYDVTYIQNFTDIDDKIINRAQKDNLPIKLITKQFIKAYFEDMERLNIKNADAYPRATHTLNGIKNLVSKLKQKGYVYESGGDVYYSVRHFKDYGKLSGRKLENLQVGASGRVDVEEFETAKKDPCDFAVWKSAKPGEPAWESPWGKGRPGWHIECSAMVLEHLGETIDLHVGGSDLIFPHHENEIAQSEAATGKPLARYWMHNGMVKVEGEKMSKSLRNFITIRDLLDKIHPMAMRLFILQTHYRKPVDFTDEVLKAATNSWHSLKEGLLFGYQYGSELGFSTSKSSSALKQRFQEVVDDDFNFAGGLAILFQIAKELRRASNVLVHQGNTDTSPKVLEEKWKTLVELAQVLGLEVDLHEDQKELNNRLSDKEIKDLIEQRKRARQSKNYVEGDCIRDKLKEHGIILVDQPEGVTNWYRS
ncbi:MAG: cysteine--tRNA ligase [cyanobacterium endosymbiont of Epithemia adnata isolate EadnSB Bon19]